MRSVRHSRNHVGLKKAQAESGLVRDQWYSETSKTAMDARVDFFRKQAELIADNTGPVRVLVVDGQPTGAATPAALTEVERCARIAQIKARILERRNA